MSCCVFCLVSGPALVLVLVLVFLVIVLSCGCLVIGESCRFVSCRVVSCLALPSLAVSRLVLFCLSFSRRLLVLLACGCVA